jgi:hypothetical protein
MRCLALALALFAIEASPAYAAEPATDIASTPSKEAIAAALPLFDSADLEEQMLSVALSKGEADFNAELEALKERKIDISDELAAKLKEVTLNEIRDAISDIMPTIRLEAATIYARYFSVEELKELKVLSTHPVLQKMEKLSPQIMTELTKIGLKAGIARRTSIEERLTQILEDYLESQKTAEGNPS